MIYLISYIPNLLYNSSDIHDFIINHLNPPTDWWHYSGVYLLDTTLTIPQITSSLRIKFPNLQHFVVKVNLEDNGGLLPKEAWDWINTKTKTTPKLKTVPTLSSLLRSQNRNTSEPNPKILNDLLDLINKNRS